MLAISLQSGSNGNCTYVEAGGTDSKPALRLLVDAGISGKRASQRLASHGRDMRNVDALLITHDHGDHVRSMGVYHRKFGLNIHITRRTYRTACKRCSLGNIAEVTHFKAGQDLIFKDVTVETIPTPHDGVDGVVFVIDDGHSRLGILTDLGHNFDGLAEIIASLDAVLLESNYDTEMLASGPYPTFVKERIRGPGGHICNIEAAELLKAAAGKRMKWAALAHLSQANNDPQLALSTHRSIVGDRLPIHLTSRYAATGVFRV